MLKKLVKVRGLSEDERVLFARNLVATPDERWELHVNFLRSHGFIQVFRKEKIRFQIASVVECRFA